MKKEDRNAVREIVREELGKIPARPTIVNIVLDCSGSMQTIKDSVISSFNEYIQSLQRKEGNYLVSVTLFNTTVLPRTVALQAIKDINPMTAESYMPDGLTALYDAIGDAVAYVGREVSALKVKYQSDIPILFVIITDGQENHSKEYDREKIRNLIKSCEGKGNYSFVYLGANQDAWANGQSIGINIGNAICFTASAVGFKGMMNDVATATMNFSASTMDDASKASSFRISDSPFPSANEDHQ